MTISGSLKYTSFAEQRHLTDTQIRLEDNTNVQRQLNETARYAELDLRAKQIDQRLEVTICFFPRGRCVMLQSLADTNQIRDWRTSSQSVECFLAWQCWTVLIRKSVTNKPYSDHFLITWTAGSNFIWSVSFFMSKIRNKVDCQHPPPQSKHTKTCLLWSLFMSRLWQIFVSEKEKKSRVAYIGYTTVLLPPGNVHNYCNNLRRPRTWKRAGPFYEAFWRRV